MIIKCYYYYYGSLTVFPWGDFLVYHSYRRSNKNKFGVIKGLIKTALWPVMVQEKEASHEALPEVPSMFPHMDVKIVFPFSHVSTFSTHEVLVVRVREHVFGEVRLVSAPEVTQAALVGLLA